MEKTTLYLPADLQRALGATAKREGRAQADIIREALTVYLSHRTPVRLRSIGAGSDDEVSGSTSENWLRKNWKTSKRAGTKR
jgi:hypothetical protein